jgi:surfeit locus 1 family protein
MKYSIYKPWLVALAALATMALTARLGFWQLQRADDKNHRRALMAQRMAQGDLPASQLAQQPSDLPDQLYRSARVSGIWLGQHTIHLENRQMNGRPGFFTLTPLLLADGSAVLVQRGWQPRHIQDRTLVQTPPNSTEIIHLQGRIQPPPSSLFEFNSPTASQNTLASTAIRLNIALDAFSREIGHPLRPLSLLQLQDEEICLVGHACKAIKHTFLVRAWEPPSTDVSKHHGYAFQWFGLCTLIGGLFIWFQIILPSRTRSNSVR